MTRDNYMSRRNFLQSLGRVTLAGLLVGGVGTLIARPAQHCINQGVCRGCPVSQGCRLPQAELARDTLSDE